MRKKREMLAPDLTPVIDIVFILLIFFMVTSVFKKEEVNLALKLPSLNAKAVQSSTQSLKFELSSTQMLIDAHRYKLSDIDSFLASVDKKTPIEIKIDKDVHYERIMKLFDKLQKQDLTNFSLVALKAKKNNK